jgi:ribosome maturation factor RimP
LPHPAIPELEHLARKLGAASQLDVVGVQVLTHRIPMTVLVQVRRGDGDDVSLDDCAAFSGPFGEALDQCGLIDGGYVLEISSPGLGDELQSDRDFRSFRSFPIEVMHVDSSGAEKRDQGLLLGRDEKAVLLNIRGRTLPIPRDQILQVRLITAGAEP